MKILMAASEMAPLARTGGLGDVLEALPPALQKLDHEISVVLPYYRAIREHKSLKIKNTGAHITAQIGGKRVDAEILECRVSGGIQVFLVKRDEYFDRSGIYGTDGRPYGDNAERYIYFSKIVVELARRLSPPPDVIHAQDWQTALIPVFANQQELPIPTVLTIHDVAFQGNFWGVDFGLTNLPAEYFSSHGLEFFGNLNFLKGGIIFSDAITTISERYAREIQMPESGCGLDSVLREQAGKLSGIMNGADYATWNPATDRLLPRKFKPDALAGKTGCRNALLKEFGLKKNPAGPVIGMVSRLSDTADLDLILPLLDRLFADDIRLIILGDGECLHERELMIAAKKHRQHFGFKHGFDNRLTHLLSAGADLSLFLSHKDPANLPLVYSLKYGAIPVARATGGLHQIIQDFDPGANTGNGFLFFENSPAALWDSIHRAKTYFTDKPAWDLITRRAMDCRFSWDETAREYEKLYKHIQF